MFAHAARNKCINHETAIPATETFSNKYLFWWNLLENLTISPKEAENLTISLKMTIVHGSVGPLIM